MSEEYLVIWKQFVMKHCCQINNNTKLYELLCTQLYVSIALNVFVYRLVIYDINLVASVTLILCDLSVTVYYIMYGR